MKTALIIGITGQDGFYLTQLLLRKGYRVVGAIKDRQEALNKIPIKLKGTIDLVEWDILDQGSIMDGLRATNPQEVYNLAAYSSGAGMYDEPVETGKVNGLAVTCLLEAIRQTDTGIRFCQASSREIFGEPQETPQTENTCTNPRSPYGAAKLYADNMVRIYRARYGLFACSAILFNHESPKRRQDFVTRKITHAAACIKLGFAAELRLGSLEARRDWGFAGDYVQAMWLMLQQPYADDYVIATGETHSVREVCDLAFSHLGMDYRDHVREDRSVFRPDEPCLLTGSSAKARACLGWSPTMGFKQLIHMMVDADMRDLGALN
jgi:GDPmannose 4,6-dehydratase